MSRDPLQMYGGFYLCQQAEDVGELLEILPEERIAQTLRVCAY